MIVERVERPEGDSRFYYRDAVDCVGGSDAVCPIGELFDRAQALARELADMPSIAVAGMLRCIVGAGDKPLAEGIAAERRAVLATMGTPDQREGMMAFLEERKPRFNQGSE